MSDRRETCDPIDGKPGRYRMVREVLVGGVYRRNTMIVSNPAYGAKVLDAWEECLREEAGSPKTAERASSLRQARQRAA